MGEGMGHGGKDVHHRERTIHRPKSAVPIQQRQDGSEVHPRERQVDEADRVGQHVRQAVGDANLSRANLCGADLSRLLGVERAIKPRSPAYSETCSI